MASNNSSKLTVRLNCSASVNKKSFLLDLCMKYDIKVEKILEKKFGFLIVCSTTRDADKIFDEAVLSLLSAGEVQPVMPVELKAERSVIVNRLDAMIYSLSIENIKQEILARNSWCTVRDVVKFSNSSGMKLTFSSSDIADRVCEQGFFITKLFIFSHYIFKDEFVPVLTCYRCYKLEDHRTSQCPQNPDYVICSLCASRDHGWKTCENVTKKCVNCDGPHPTLSMSCP